MPYYGDRLGRSEFNARASDAEWRAGHNLWWAAWNSVPAASLPNDEIALTRYADLGRDVKAFRKLRGLALHGFVLCSDGRLYHPWLAKLALEAWERRIRERERKKRWRDGQRHSVDGVIDVSEDVSGTSPGRGQSHDVPVSGTDDRRGQDRTGQEKEEESDGPRKRGARLPNDMALPSEWRAWCAERRPDLDPDTVWLEFHNYWTSKPGRDAVKLDWFKTWQNRVMNVRGASHGKTNGKPALTATEGLFAGAAIALRRDAERERDRNHGPDIRPVEPLPDGERRTPDPRVPDGGLA
jgi:hypothetical protein